ncbi:hypothetical protein K2173_026041 [Erythroxylum novogranatense]|uniref:Uncharacterized protein n=1 Tax=Erythroxylum novogranatense TaxID=1862640 RepID=A0AAV8SIM4_9ROSI|nr:hypothetical protein K2173_026041 [Erythroxylum novogranatense]
MGSDADAQVLALPPPEAEFHLSSLVYDMSHQIQMAMANMLKITKEVDHDSMGITEEISRCKDSALERKKALEDEKEKFQKAAYTVLNMLNN